MDSMQDAEQYAKERGVAALREAVATGTIGGRGKRFAEALLDRHEREQIAIQAIKESADRDTEIGLLARATIAAEASASSARVSARWAIGAAAIAVLAIIVALATAWYKGELPPPT